MISVPDIGQFSSRFILNKLFLQNVIQFLGASETKTQMTRAPQKRKSCCVWWSTQRSECSHCNCCHNGVFTFRSFASLDVWGLNSGIGFLSLCVCQSYASDAGSDLHFCGPWNNTVLWSVTFYLLLYLSSFLAGGSWLASSLSLQS